MENSRSFSTSTKFGGRPDHPHLYLSIFHTIGLFLVLHTRANIDHSYSRFRISIDRSSSVLRELCETSNMASESSELAGIAAPDSQSEEEQPQEAQAEPRSLLARLIDARNRDLSLFVPFLLRSTTSLPSSGATDADLPDLDQNQPRPDGTELETDQTPQNTETQTQQRDRMVLVNSRTQEILVIEGENISSFFENLPTIRKGQPPASKSSIEAMPTVETKEGEVEEEGECAICLDDWEIGKKIVKEMPCKHRFHGDCIEKWLEIHGSCPICRYKMPVEEEEGEKEGGGRGRVEREILVRVSFISSNRDGAHHGELTVETGERS